MKQFIKTDPWKLVETTFHPEYHANSESIFSIGNGKMGQRANFEEDYSGDSLRGNYVAGIYYPDKTRVGWWKNGYPEYFAKVLNAVNWIGLHIKINGELLDLNKCEILNFERVLDMQHSLLKRRFTARLANGNEVSVEAVRFYSLADDEIGALSYTVKAENFDGKVEIESYLDFNVVNQDSNYDQRFWEPISQEINGDYGQVKSVTKKTNFIVACGMHNSLFVNGDRTEAGKEVTEQNQLVSHKFSLQVSQGDTITLEKIISTVSTFYYEADQMDEACRKNVERGVAKGFDALKKEHALKWEENWTHYDIEIEGDVSAQQAIRFNIFQLNQTYTGKDDRLNIGPKGFTGEKYGGSTYWDTEAYCLPFYLSTAPQDVARNLLLYRYKHLGKAIENAGKLGFNSGAALYPMVTMNGEECHNEWEITFEEVHRNGAIAYAIFDYVRYTGDREYLIDYGLEVLIAISRFWAQRVHFSQVKQQYVIHGVTGPNEFENNVNNNWYTNFIAKWCLNYTSEIMEEVKTKAPQKYTALLGKLNLNETETLNSWAEIADKMHLPEDKERGIYLQQEGFLDKEIIPVADLDPKHLPIVQNWSWDRILRSCYIKQADVLQGLYFFEDQFSKETIKRNFDYYEPITVHESSLSPCVHCILASAIGNEEKAYEMFMRTARLDIDDFNNDTEDGCHITSMAGTWGAFVKGFGGMRVQNDQLSLAPFLPKSWKGYAFTIGFRGHWITVKVKPDAITIINKEGGPMQVTLHGKDLTIQEGENILAHALH
ncbi:MAG: glycoside hydrolase family 65 protein [Bacteroidetes bacterium]|nr:MAG: glycoside hydrolase family 65 protein [Bacteroidota bacterium]